MAAGELYIYMTATTSELRFRDSGDTLRSFEEDSGSPTSSTTLPAGGIAYSPAWNEIWWSRNGTQLHFRAVNGTGASTSTPAGAIRINGTRLEVSDGTNWRY